MRRASTGVAQAVIGELKRTGGCYGRAVGLVIGAGNNGGDALYAGAILARRGVRCSAVLLVPGGAHEGGLAALLGAGGRVVDTLPESLDLVIDGVLGIGGIWSAAARGRRRVRRQVTAPIVAVDLPSGVDADTGVVNEPSVRATITVTFGAYRNAHLLAARRDAAGSTWSTSACRRPNPPGRTVPPHRRRGGRPVAGAGTGRRQVHAGRYRHCRRIGALSGAAILARVPRCRRRPG